MKKPTSTSSKYSLANQKPHQQQQQSNNQTPHHRTRSEIANSLLQQAQKKATKFERPPFDPNATISYFEEESRVTPRRNYRGVLAENPSNYFEFPIPSWIKADTPPPPSQSYQFPRGITSALAQVQRQHLGNGSNVENAAPPSVFPELSVVRATGALRDDTSYRENSKRNSIVTTNSQEPGFMFQKSSKNNNDDNDHDQQKSDMMAMKQNLKFSSTVISNLLTFNMATLLECESRERKLIAEHSEDLFIHVVTQKQQDLRIKTMDSAQKRAARRQYDKALETLMNGRLELLGDASDQMCNTLWDEFDLTRDSSLISTLLKMNNEGGDDKKQKNGGEQDRRAAAKKDEAAHQNDLETRLAELETLLSWNKFERRRLEELLRRETADATAAKAARDATMQQLASLEAECVPLIQGMKEIFGADGRSPIQNNNNINNSSTALNQNNHSFGNHSYLGSIMGTNDQQQQQSQDASAGVQQQQPQHVTNRVKTALERVADQIEQSPLHKNNNNNVSLSSSSLLQQQPDFQTLPPKRILESLDTETLANMILLERQLSNRMLIGAKSQVFAEVEAQKRFVDTSILLKKQAAHAMFLADLFQHRLPQLRRACNALGNVVHKFENSSASSSSSSSLRHKSNVVSRHNQSSAVVFEGTGGGGGGAPVLTHSALVAYSKSLVAHVSAMLRWLDTEAG